MSFYLLFRPVDRFVARTLLLFATVNSVAILASAAFLATALDVALGGAAADGAAASLAQVMYLVSGNLWGVAAVFFGLWLIPIQQKSDSSACFNGAIRNGGSHTECGDSTRQIQFWKSV